MFLFTLKRTLFIARQVDIQASSSDPNTWAKIKHLQGLASAVQELRSKLEQQETQLQRNRNNDLAATIGLSGAVGATMTALVIYAFKQYLSKKLEDNKTLAMRKQTSLPVGFYTEG